jgi:Mg2+/Co2+ transporter CorC
MLQNLLYIGAALRPMLMMKHALDLPEFVVGDLLRTRNQLASLRDGQTRQHVLAEFQRTRFSRHPGSMSTLIRWAACCI